MADIKRTPYTSRVSIRSTPVGSGGVTAWHLRDFVATMDKAGVPDKATLTAHHANDTRHFEAISVAFDVLMPPESADVPDDEPEDIERITEALYHAMTWYPGRPDDAFERTDRKELWREAARRFAEHYQRHG